jgi:uncharacterized membrane protein YGL010W
MESYFILKNSYMISYILNNLYFNPTLEGYKVYRRFHSNCWNGLLHTLFMPVAVTGFFFLINWIFFHTYLLNKKLVSQLQKIFLFCFTFGWMFYDPLGGLLTFAFYYGLFNFNDLMFYSNKNRTSYFYLKYGILLLGGSVLFLECVGHGYTEHHHSHLWEMFNSFFHTPLYGINSLYYPFVGKCWFHPNDTFQYF